QKPEASKAPPAKLEAVKIQTKPEAKQPESKQETKSGVKAEKTEASPANAEGPAEAANGEDKGEASEDEADTDTPVSHEKIAGDESLTAARPWRMPDYANQNEAIGYSPAAFAVPAGLEKNVAFWVDIYTRYSTDQGLIHDSEYMDLIYEVLDFSPVMMRRDIDVYQKERIKTKQVKESKKRVIALLKKLSTTEDPTGLTDQEKKIWDYFAKIDDKKKFKDAQHKSRLRFQLGQRDRAIQGIFFSGRYLEEFEKIFRESGLPIELTRLPFVESSFNVLARSKVGASGLWQIMRYTGRPHMMINQAIDKRNHPMEAARLAARLLRSNFDMLGTWPLAVTGWNHGPSGVLRLTKIHKSRELGDLFPRNARKRLGFASRNFFASFLAILEVERNAPKYFGQVMWSQPLASVDVNLPFAVKYSDVLRWFDGDDNRAQIFNPQITTLARKNRIALPKGALISVPVSKGDQVKAELADPKKFRRVGVR
ncbi:MAG: hypothetical protein C5B49_07170, partial [Bdellovibrio sp.]